MQLDWAERLVPTISPVASRVVVVLALCTGSVSGPFVFQLLCRSLFCSLVNGPRLALSFFFFFYFVPKSALQTRTMQTRWWWWPLDEKIKQDAHVLLPAVGPGWLLSQHRPLPRPASLCLLLATNERLCKIPLKWTVVGDTGKETVQKNKSQ